MMSQDEAAEQLFGEALELEGDERQAFLDRACQDEPVLRLVVQKFLEENDRLQGFLSEAPLSPPLRRPAAVSQKAPASGAIPSSNRSGQAESSPRKWCFERMGAAPRRLARAPDHQFQIR